MIASPVDPEASSELRAILAEVDRFVTRAIAPVVARPEAPAPIEAVEGLLAEARALGIIAGDVTSGAGLWEDATAPTRSVRVLERIARANGGVALAAHLESMGRWLVQRAGIPIPGVGVAALQGRFGLGRGALARVLTGAGLDDEDRRMLADTYGDGPRLLTTPHHFDWLAVPRFDAKASLRFEVLARASLVVEEHPHAHGLDELATFSFSLAPGAEPLRVAEPGRGEGAELFAEALAITSVGLLAVALGAAEHAHDLARRYSGTRRQGGKIIDRHAAVQQLLASSRGAIETVRAQLDSLSRGPLAAAALPRILALRAEGHVLLCRGANDALQAFGGLGYMRDTGAEKVVRDLDHLRATCGSPSELALVVAEWERAHG